MSRGVIYIGTGAKNLQRVLQSAQSVKRYMPDLSIRLITDADNYDPVFDEVIKIERPQHFYLARIQHLMASPYDETLSLDVDTYLCGDISEMFELLGKFDLLLCHDTFRVYAQGYEFLKDSIHAIPESFPMLNAGVILYRRSVDTEDFFERWSVAYQRDLQLGEKHSHQGTISDQPALREALYQSNARLGVLPTEYNCRFNHSFFVNRKVKILHGAHYNLDAAEDEMNRRIENRVFSPSVGMIFESTAFPVLFNKWYFSGLIYNLQQTIKRYLRVIGVKG